MCAVSVKGLSSGCVIVLTIEVMVEEAVAAVLRNVPLSTSTWWNSLWGQSATYCKSKLPHFYRATQLCRGGFTGSGEGRPPNRHRHQKILQKSEEITCIAITCCIFHRGVYRVCMRAKPPNTQISLPISWIVQPPKSQIANMADMSFSICSPKCFLSAIYFSHSFLYSRLIFAIIFISFYV